MEDQYAGQGGSYVVDKKGNRVLVERTQDAPPAEAPETVAADPAEPPLPFDGSDNDGATD
jgi:hypothetical protein